MHNTTLTHRRWLAFTAALILQSSFFVLHSSAQSDDFGLDFALEAEKKLCKGVDFSLEAEARTQDNTQKMERWTVGGTLGVRLFQNSSKTFSIKASAGWKYMWIYNLAETKDKYEAYEQITPTGTMITNEYEGYNETLASWRHRHRTSVSLAANYKPNKRWSFQLKETVQYTHFCKDSTDVNKYRLEDEDDPTSLYLKKTEGKTYRAKDKTVLRSKLTAQYDIRNCKLDPYVSVDYGCGLNYTANKWKFTAGTDYKLTKQSKFNLFYRYTTEDDEEDPNGHLIGIGYQFKF